MTSKNKSLCICLTPLHVLIAARIAEHEGIKFDRGVYLANTNNEKNKFYAKEMDLFCNTVDFILLPNETSFSKLRHLHIYLSRLYFRIKFTKYCRFNTVYLGNSIHNYLFALLSAISFFRCVTFDDGILNIKTNSELKRKDKSTSKLFLYLSGITFSKEKLISKSNLHYSIYSNPNVFGNVKIIHLLDVDRQAANIVSETKIVKIFLGSPPEFSSDIWKIIGESVKKIQPDGYLPHPREVEKKIFNVKYIDTKYVAEHYVLNLLSESSNVQCELYGYEGSALLNLAGQERIKVFSVMSQNDENLELIHLMKSAGVNFIQDSI